jgi:phosphatidylinositol alpha-1,6-mannosyltransferase
MKSKNNHLLLSMDFRPGKGGIARLARLISMSIEFDAVFSIHGSHSKEDKVKYFDQNRWAFSLNVLAYIIKYKPDIIILDHLYLTRLLLFVPNFYLKKVVVYLHDEEAWISVNKIHQLGLEKTSHILCNSEYTKNRFISNNRQFEDKCSTCLPGGVPNEFITSETEISDRYLTWINDPRPYCLFVSRLWKEHRYKGHFKLVEAFKKYYLKKQGQNIRLAIIGNGNDFDEINRFIINNNLLGTIGLFNDVSDQDLVNFYKASNCLFFPSTREGFGMVYLEAMFFKKACIGIAGQPCEEIIVHNETGILLQNSEVSELVKVINELESNPNKYINYGIAGYERYERYFTNAHFKERFLSLIGEPDGINDSI